jgi:hypothetical protein
VIDQLNGLKFPPIVVSMSVVWVKDPDGVVDKVPQTTVCYFTTDGDGKNSRCPSRLKRPPTMALADIIDGLPLKEGKKQDRKVPEYWVSPGTTGAVHVFVPLVADSGISLACLIPASAGLLCAQKSASSRWYSSKYLRRTTVISPFTRRLSAA